MAYVHLKILNFPQLRQCIAWKVHPWQSAKSLPLGPNRRNILLQLGFQWLLGYGAVFKNPSWFWHSAYGSQCKSTAPIPSCILILLHCPWALTRANSAWFLYFLHVCTDFFHHWSGILWNLSLKGSSSVTLVSCFAMSVQPNSPGSREKTHDTQPTGLKQLLDFPPTTSPSQIDPAFEGESPSSIQLTSSSVGYPGSCLVSPEFWVSISLWGQHLQLLLGQL